MKTSKLAKLIFEAIVTECEGDINAVSDIIERCAADRTILKELLEGLVLDMSFIDNEGSK